MRAGSSPDASISPKNGGWAEVTYGCLVCKYKNICPAGDECNFALNFEKLIKEVNEDQLEPISNHLVKEDYYI